MKETPTLYARLPVPFDQLQPEPFADFVFEAVQRIKASDWHSFLKTDVGADGGFDAYATRRSDGAIACVQCKRMQNVSVPELAHELAKVALTSALKNISTKSYLMVCAGHVRSKLVTQLHQNNRVDLRAEAIEKAKATQLEGLRQEAADAGIDVAATVDAFVRDVELEVWSHGGFDTRLGAVWNDIQGLLARVFTVHALVSEYPRPDFDETAYTGGLRSPAGASSLLARPVEPPNNVWSADPADPLASRPAASPSQELVDLSEILDAVQAGRTDLIVAPGGGGKSTTAKQLVADQAQRRQRDPLSWLPVLIDISSHAGDLNRDINATLGLRRGVWTGIPGRVLLVLDGLDRMPRGSLGILTRQINDLVKLDGVAVLLTCRTTGPIAPIELPSLGTAWALQPCGVGHAQRLARAALAPERVTPFVDSWLQHARLKSFFALPQGLACCVRVYKDTGALLDSQRALLDYIVSARARVERARAAALPTHLASVPFDTVRRLAAWVGRFLWLEGEETNFPRAQVLVAISSAMSKLRDEGVFGSDALSHVDALALLTHTALLVESPNDTFSFEHDNLAALFASDFVAATWRDHLATLDCWHGDDAWILASSAVAVSERSEFLACVAAHDLRLAAICAVEMGQPQLMEDLILQRAAAADRQVLVASAAHALEALGTPNAVNFLQSRTVGGLHTYRDDWSSQSWRALAAMGEPAVLDQILARMDLTLSSPIKMSGGEVDWWALAPPSAALAAARRRCSRDPARVGPATIDALCTWGTAEDWNAAEVVLMEQSQSISSFQKGVVALSRVDRAAAERVIGDAAQHSDDDSRAYIFDVAEHLGFPVDSDWLLTYVLSPFTPDGGASQDDERSRFASWQMAHRLAAKVLTRLDPLENVGTRAVAALVQPSIDDQIGEWAWSVAAHHAPNAVAPLARDALLSDTGFVAAAARFAIGYQFPPDVRDQLRHTIMTRLKSTQQRDPPCERCEVELLEAWGEAGLAASTVRSRITSLCDALDSLDPKSVDAFSTRMELASWTRIAVRHLGSFTGSELMRVLLADLSHMSHATPFVEGAASCLSDEQLDSVIESHQVFEIRLVLNAVASKRGRTPVRYSTFLESIRASKFRGLSDKDPTIRALDNLWCDSTAADVVRILGEGPYPRDIQEQMARPVIVRVATRLTRTEAERIVGPVLATATDVVGRRVLQFIMDVTERAPNTPPSDSDRA